MYCSLAFEFRQGFETLRCSLFRRWYYWISVFIGWRESLKGLDQAITNWALFRYYDRCSSLFIGMEGFFLVVSWVYQTEAMPSLLVVSQLEYFCSTVILTNCDSTGPHYSPFSIGSSLLNHYWLSFSWMTVIQPNFWPWGSQAGLLDSANYLVLLVRPFSIQYSIWGTEG